MIEDKFVMENTQNDNSLETIRINYLFLNLNNELEPIHLEFDEKLNKLKKDLIEDRIKFNMDEFFKSI